MFGDIVFEQQLVDALMGESTGGYLLDNVIKIGRNALIPVRGIGHDHLALRRRNRILASFRDYQQLRLLARGTLKTSSRRVRRTLTFPA